MSIFEKNYEYSSTCIYKEPCENEVRLYTLFKKNCNVLDRESIVKNNELFAKEMLMIRSFLDENNISFPLDKKNIEPVKDKLANFVIKNNMDIILILLDNENIRLLFVLEEDNDDLINKIESIIFKSNKNVILAKVKV
tara:strand:- start:6340 stop:6753 length:414 start_codon:yes stop_codon:yes gene_type:complete